MTIARPKSTASSGSRAEEIKAEAGIEFFEWLQQQEKPAAVSA